MADTFDFGLIERAPFCALLGIKIESAANGEARVRMPFRLNLLNEGGPQAPIHGGAIASLIDTAALTALLTAPDLQRTATIALTINYVNAGVHSDLIASARLRKRGRRIASLSVEIADEAGQLIADALVTFRIG
ncbi:MAG TPA: PaaI family thioesterase [Candidatus Binataceae bacterium]|nr:PaaI family thioesterase [Candidatus Binataceae bacterium]